MITLVASKKFVKDLQRFKKQPILRKKIAKTLDLLKSNPRHPSLNLERIVNDPTAWSIRVDKYYRLAIEPLQQTQHLAADWQSGILLLRILSHDDLYRSPH